MTEKSDSTVLVPGNTDANPPHKRFSFWNYVPRIPHPPSKEVFEVQASKAVLMVPFLSTCRQVLGIHLGDHPALVH